VTSRRFSQAISEGDGISVIVSVDGPQAARIAAESGAEALLVSADAVATLGAIRDVTELPILAVLGSNDDPPVGADACLVDVAAAARDRLEELHRDLDACELALRIESEDDLEMVMEAFDPEIVVLGVAAGDDATRTALLELLPDVPAGKLAIADAGTPSKEDVGELERAGIDGVIVAAGNVAHLVGAAPPEV